MSKKAPKPKWGFDADNWPDQRTDKYWKELNRGQKAYAIRAYNKARVNKGLEPIRNPFNKDGSSIYENEKGDETITQRTKGKVKISPLNRAAISNFIETVTRRSDNPGPLLEMMSRQESRLGDYYDDPQLMDLIKNYDFEGFDQAGISGSNKRPAENQLEKPGPSKVDRTERPPTTEADMVLPGTASSTEDDNMIVDEAGTASRGKGASAGGFSSGTGPMVTVARPMNFANSGGLTFQKVHRVLAYGLASVPLIHPLNTDPSTTAPVLLMTTSLMEIPWDRSFFYLTPGELDSLPKGCYVKSLHISVVQRNPRVAFETASSTSALATLNQNKFGVKAIGLNAKNGLRVTSRRYDGFEAGEPMVPNNTTEATYNDIDLAMYGKEQTDATFNTAIPSSCFMQPIQMPNYLTCWNTGYDAALVGTTKKTGWYSLAEHVQQFDMSATAGTEIINAHYKPSYAPLTPQTDFAEYLTGQLGNPAAGGVDFNEFTYTDGDTTKQVSRITITGLNGANNLIPQETYQTVSTDRNTFDSLASQSNNRYSTLERGQETKNIDMSQNPKCVQPSVHVGISPVPRLTSNAVGVQPASWTDVQAYYEIKATMDVGYHFPHHNTHQSEFNIEANDVKMGVTGSSVDANVYPVRFGKHNQTF